jgi:GAF domain
MESKLTEKKFDLEILRSVLKDVIDEIQKISDCQSVSIRLYEDGDFPYFSYKGFSDFFIAKENSLNVRNNKGVIVLNADGTPFVECMCGNILKGRINTRRSYFTEDGAFWTNSTTLLLGGLTKKQREEIGKTRNTCHDCGYESVALIPIRAEGTTIGLVQINDPRENMFTLRKVQKYQSLADHLGSLIFNLLAFYEETGKISNPMSTLKKA